MYQEIRPFYWVSFCLALIFFSLGLREGRNTDKWGVFKWWKGQRMIIIAIDGFGFLFLCSNCSHHQHLQHMNNCACPLVTTRKIFIFCWECCWHSSSKKTNVNCTLLLMVAEWLEHHRGLITQEILSSLFQCFFQDWKRLNTISLFCNLKFQNWKIDHYVVWFETEYNISILKE